MSAQRGSNLAALFKVLSNDTRLRLLHALVRDEGLCVGVCPAPGYGRAKRCV